MFGVLAFLVSSPLYTLNRSGADAKAREIYQVLGMKIERTMFSKMGFWEQPVHDTLKDSESPEMDEIFTGADLKE